MKGERYFTSRVQFQHSLYFDNKVLEAPLFRDLTFVCLLQVCLCDFCQQKWSFVNHPPTADYVSLTANSKSTSMSPLAAA